MDAVEAGAWPIPWISPLHLITLLTLVWFPTLQGVTGMLIVGLLAPGSAKRATPCRWCRIVLSAVLPMSALGLALRWLAMPSTSITLERFAWPGFAFLAMGLVAMGLAAGVCHWRGREPSAPRQVPWKTVAALGGMVAIAGWAFISVARIDPGPRIEPGLEPFAVRPVALIVVLTLLAAPTVGLGAAVHMVANADRRGAARLAAVIAAATGGVALLMTAWALAPKALPDAAMQVAEPAAPGPAPVVRWTIVALGSCGGLALAAHFTSGSTGVRTILLLAALAAVSMQATLESHRGPWNLRGIQYESGLSAAYVHTHRRSPLVPSQGKVDGREVFDSQCGVCHARAGPLVGWKSRLNGDVGQIPTWMESLRDADRLGHPYRGTMPPLVGSDREVEALSEWTRRASGPP